MGSGTGDVGGRTLAEVRARTALREAGLDPTVPLTPASSVTNEVWLTEHHSVRVNRRTSNRLFREAQIGAVLPPEVGYPPIVAHGGGRGEDWLIQERRPGRPLAHIWPTLTAHEREAAVHATAARLRAIHQTEAPPDLPPIDRAPQLLAIGSSEPAAPLLSALLQAGSLEHVDPALMTEAADQVEALAPALQPFESTTLVHGDVTFENILWHDGEVVALLDVEWARPGPRDLDLDILLRCCAYPDLHVGDDHVGQTRAEDYAEVPWWFGEAYPELFEYPRQIDRVRVYSIAYDVQDLLAAPPTRPPRHLTDRHAYHRLQRVVERKSYIDVLGRGRF
jgi:scyllo-inosamine 4-kinase